MVKYMSLEEQVDKEFLRAKHRAFFRRLVARGRGLPEREALLAFDAARRAVGADNRLCLYKLGDVCFVETATTGSLWPATRGYSG